jgi:hypothetical protein
MPVGAKKVRTLRAALVLAGLALAPAAHSAAPSSQRLVYSVHHSRYGSLGTYSNAVQTSGDVTTVNTEVHIRVSILGVVLYRQEAARQERWTDGRLVAFHGVTTVNGRPFEMDGAAQGDRFVVMSPEGEVAVPASVRIANPWSSDVLHGDTLLTPDRGRVEHVEVKPAKDTSVPINGHATRAKRYEVDRIGGQKRYDIWMDDHGVPVMFTIYNPNGSVTFTLSS